MRLQLLAQLLVVVTAVKPAQPSRAAAEQQSAQEQDDQDLPPLTADVQLRLHCVAASSALRSGPANSFHSPAVVSAIISKWCCTTRSRACRRTWSSFSMVACISAREISGCVLSARICVRVSKSTRRSASRSSCRASMDRNRPALRCVSSTCFVAALRIFSRSAATASDPASLLDEQAAASHPVASITASICGIRIALNENRAPATLQHLRGRCSSIAPATALVERLRGQPQVSDQPLRFPIALLVRAAQYRGRMHRGQHTRRQPGIDPFAAHAGHAEVRTQQGLCCRRAKAHEDFRLHQRNLLIQPWLAGMHLCAVGFLVQTHLATPLELEMLHHIRDVDVLAFQSRLREAVLQYLSGRPDEGMPEAILLVARHLAHQHQCGGCGTFTEYGLGGVAMQRAGNALRGPPAQRRQRRLNRNEFGRRVRWSREILVSHDRPPRPVAAATALLPSPPRC